MLYKNLSGIVKIVPLEENITALDFHTSAKEFFKIGVNVQFFYSKTTCFISDDDLVQYTKPFQNSPGWSLSVSDAIELLDNSIQLSTVTSHDDPLTLEKVIEDSNLIEPVEEETLLHTVTLPYRSLSFYGNENFSKNSVQTIVRTQISVEILECWSDLDYKILYANYQKLQTFSNTERTKLAKVLVKKLLESVNNLELNKPDLLYVSDIICQIFTSEIKEVYYTAAVFAQKPSGKLYDAYSNYRRFLNSAGLITRRTFSKQTAQVDSSVPDANPDELLDLEFIKKNAEANDVLIEKWNKSFPQRFKILEDIKITTHDYISMFPIFNSNNHFVFNLFIADAKKRYPEIQDIHTVWNDIYTRILKKSTKLTDPLVKQWIDLTANSNESTKKAIAFLILPYFFPATNIKAKSKKSFKVSKVEIQEKFVAYFKTLEEADNHEQKILSSQSQSALQPRIVFVGEVDKLVSYVSLIDKKYNIEDPVKAVEIGFILYCALNIIYPEESLVVWNFVQKYIFGVYTVYDLNKPSIRAVYQRLMEN